MQFIIILQNLLLAMSGLKNNNRDQQYDLRNLDNFIIPKPRFEGFKKYPHYSFAKVW